MKKQKELKVGIIGTSRRTYSLLPCYKQMKGCKVTALCDKIGARLQKAHAMLGDKDVACYADHREMLKKADVEAVFVDVAPEDNVALVCEALEAGKHVMCEVPLAFTIEDCWKAVLAVEKSGLKFQMNEHTHPREAVISGHGGADFWPIYNFIKCVQEGKEPPMDVYKAAEASAPAIMASKSVEKDSQCLEVPDFRPNARRKAGQSPKK